jgi:hypothetical protein
MDGLASLKQQMSRHLSRQVPNLAEGIEESTSRRLRMMVLSEDYSYWCSQKECRHLTQETGKRASQNGWIVPAANKGVEVERIAQDEMAVLVGFFRLNDLLGGFLPRSGL